MQEEIRFAICPELIASRLFTEVLLENEVLMVYGPERFCSYQGYGSSFQCAGDFEDEVELDTETGTNGFYISYQCAARRFLQVYLTVALCWQGIWRRLWRR